MVRRHLLALIAVVIIASITSSGCLGVAPAVISSDDCAGEESPTITSNHNNNTPFPTLTTPTKSNLSTGTPPEFDVNESLSDQDEDHSKLNDTLDEIPDYKEANETSATPTADSTPPPVIDIAILDVRFDPPGNDRENLNGEWVEILNKGASEVDIGGMVIVDEKDHLYVFPADFKLSQGANVKIHVGVGDDTAADLYMGGKSPIWNNDGDTATLFDRDGTIIDQYTYTAEITPTPSTGTIPTPTQPQTYPIEVVIERISFDPEGNDRENLNGEWVKILNRGVNEIYMVGWILQDAKNHSYVFPEGFRLSSGGRVKIHVGAGDNTAADLYMGGKTPIWNNDGDTATLFDEMGAVVDEYSY
ncbi:MAG: Intermediate filament tail domain protein [Candidatus Syntrophoarchaeum sp. GoM_oil]|nr:MAG: Intermediate filament tail domain protein [Candidatus Syntrophoarchaeum sp. GoM_oil]